MENIKIKFCTLLLFIIIFFGISFSSLLEICSAEESDVNISILDEPTYKLNNTIIKNGKILGKTYQINIILGNTGSIKSDEIEVNLTDEEGFTLTQRTYFEPGETKTIYFTWSTIKIKNQNLKVYFYPFDTDTLWTKYNSGNKKFTIKVVDDGMTGTTTPGFEMILLIMTIISITYFMKKKD